MEERKNTLISTANILGLSFEEFNNGNTVTILEMLNMKNEIDKHDLNENEISFIYSDTFIMVNYALASPDQMFPPYYSYKLRNSNFKSSWMEGYPCDIRY